MQDSQPPREELLTRDGKTPRVRVYPAKGSRGKLKSRNVLANTMSPFDRFASSNGRGNVKSF